MKKFLAITISLLMLISLIPLYTVAETLAYSPLSAEVNVVKTLNPNTTMLVSHEDRIKIVSNVGNEIIYYCWDDGEVWQTLDATTEYILSIPQEFEVNTVHHLYVSAGNMDDLTKNFYQIIVSEAKPSLVSMDIYVNGDRVGYGKTYEVSGGERIEAFATTQISNSSIYKIGYYFVNEAGEVTEIVNTEGNVLLTTVPEGNPGTETVMFIEAVDSTDDGTNGAVTKTGWIGFKLKYI